MQNTVLRTLTKYLNIHQNRLRTFQKPLEIGSPKRTQSMCEPMADTLNNNDSAKLELQYISHYKQEGNKSRYVDDLGHYRQ